MSAVVLSQPAVLAAVPPFGRFLTLDIADEGLAKGRLLALRDTISIARTAIGIGEPLALALGKKIEGLRSFPAVTGPGVAFPSTQGALWAFLAGDDPGDVFDRARALLAVTGGVFVLREDVATFKYKEGRDLSGYVDGTENPVDERAAEAAIARGRGEGHDGGSFVAAQTWVHDLDALASMPERARDNLVGRRISDNQEIADAPASAHVKRTAQESFEPPAFMVRRSMPFGDARVHGLYFVAYGESLDRYERALRRMAGQDDGITDGLLRFSRAKTGGYYFCPPVRAGKLDLSTLGL
jgi:porphyrinogen peroxidase